MSTRRSKGATGFLAVVAIVAAIASVVAVGGAGAGSQSPFALPRAETLYVSGKQWGPYTNFNPLRPDYNTGTVGLVY